MLIKESKLRQIIKSVLREAYDKPYRSIPTVSNARKMYLGDFKQDPNKQPGAGMWRGLNQDLDSFDNWSYEPEYTGYDQLNQSDGMCVQDISNSLVLTSSDRQAGMKCYAVSLCMNDSGKRKTTQIDRNPYGAVSRMETIDQPSLTADEAAAEMGIPKNSIVIDIEQYLTTVGLQNPKATGASVEVYIVPKENIVIVKWEFWPTASAGNSIYDLNTGECKKDNCPV